MPAFLPAAKCCSRQRPQIIYTLVMLLVIQLLVISGLSVLVADEQSKLSFNSASEMTLVVDFHLVCLSALVRAAG